MNIPLWSPVQSVGAAGIAPVSGGVYTRTVEMHCLSHPAGPRAWNTEQKCCNSSSFYKTTQPWQSHDNDLHLSTVVWFSISSGLSSWFSDLATCSLMQPSKVVPCFSASFSSSWCKEKKKKEKHNKKQHRLLNSYLVSLYEVRWWRVTKDIHLCTINTVL